MDFLVVAANKKGIDLVCELIDHYGLEVVQAYMGHIQTNAEIAVRDMLRVVTKDTLRRTGRSVLEAVEHMDDGSPICLKVTLNETEGSAYCDFGPSRRHHLSDIIETLQHNGTGPEVWGNCNAPKAITLSALIYCLRCMVGHDVPLNQGGFSPFGRLVGAMGFEISTIIQHPRKRTSTLSISVSNFLKKYEGCLAPVQTNIPKGSILDPSDSSAVVGGNVLTSQRIVDVVLKAFRVCAASQGCMNNITFGNESWGCYETVAGGSGAGPTWHGCSGVHTHMTNTRITDVEIVERRYPVQVRKFTLRPRTGGNGKFHGGDGVLRELQFRAPLTLSCLPRGGCYSLTVWKVTNVFVDRKLSRVEDESKEAVLPSLVSEETNNSVVFLFFQVANQALEGSIFSSGSGEGPSISARKLQCQSNQG
ncbi:hypothetical protein NQ317_008284 [Molorchus minor]|uniref:Hydantoinase B/oxoprolinase domain-containing protein n=1 Tax=Molorchus minor TaxID=1323400 RepID=A0ABQ9JDT9_9CUCU|nr:hypothetical protein NQ317_008284 [Molorchus minor]